MAKIRTLTDADLAAVQRVLDWFRSQRAGPSPNRPQWADREDPDAPEVYVARTPAGGIPALTEESGTGFLDLPGSATCDIYHLDPDSRRISPIFGLTKKVHNLSHDPIGGRRWVMVQRDKQGDWYVSAPPSPEPSLTDTGTGTGVEGGHHVYRYYCEDGSLNEYSQLIVADRVAGPEEYVRTIACCDPTCAGDEAWYCMQPPPETGTATGTMPWIRRLCCCPSVTIPVRLSLSQTSAPAGCSDVDGRYTCVWTDPEAWWASCTDFFPGSVNSRSGQGGWLFTGTKVEPSGAYHKRVHVFVYCEGVSSGTPGEPFEPCFMKAVVARGPLYPIATTPPTIQEHCASPTGVWDFSFQGSLEIDTCTPFWASGFGFDSFPSCQTFVEVTEMT